MNIFYGLGVLPEHFMLEYLQNLDPQKTNENIQEFLQKHGDKKIKDAWCRNRENNDLRSILVQEFVDLIFLLKREYHVIEQWPKRKCESQPEPR